MQHRKTHALRLLRQSRRGKEGGWLMAELALTLAIGTILLAGQLSQAIQAINILNSTNTGKYLLTLQGGINKHVENNNTALKNGAAVAGFANPLQPTIAELIAASDLPAGFGTSSPLGLGFKTVLSKTGTCPSGPDCVVSGYAYSTQPYTDGDGTLRTDMLTYAVGTIGPDGGIAMAETPTKLTFPGGSTVSNPAGSVAGTLGIRVGSGSGLLPLLSQYYLLDGSRALTGNMNANGYDINSVGNLTVNGKTATSTLTVANDTTFTSVGTPGTSCSTDMSVRRNASGTGLVVCSSGTWQMVGNAMAGIADGASCGSAGQLGSDPTGISYICNGAYWASVNSAANPGDSCAPAGKVATSIATREQLVCKNGVYVRFVNLIAKAVEVSRQLVTDGTAVTKPSCDVGGTAVYTFELTQTVVDVSVTPPRQAMYISATDNGSNWTIALRVKDNAGGDFSANSYSVSAVMKLECAY